MPRHLTTRVPEIAGIDLEFRPTSYWDDLDPLSSIVQNIKGQNRREMARDLIAGGLDAELGPIESDLLEDALPDAHRLALGQIAPSFMGGEYLPDYIPGEVEIARVVLESVTRDVYSLRVRRGRPGARLRYRLVDEYEATFVLNPASSRRPLSLRALVHLIDTAQSDAVETLGESFPEGFLAWQRENGERVDASFVSVESIHYPELGSYYRQRLDAYADALNAEFEEEHGEDETGQ
jgi:hypothetical protein